MQVATLMSKHPIAVAPTTSLDRAMDLIDEHEIRHLPVVDDEGLVGMISDRDLLEATGWLHPSQREALEAPQGTVGDFMSTPVVTVAPSDPLEAAFELIAEQRIGCLPVVEEGRLVGVITEVDVLQGYCDACRIGRIPTDRDERLEDVLTPQPLTIGADDCGSDAERLLREARIRHLPVVADGHLVGVVSDRDVRLERGRGRLDLATIEEMMSPRPRTLRPHSRLSSAALLMSAERIGAIPITDDRGLIGIATRVDVVAPCARALQTLD